MKLRRIDYRPESAPHTLRVNCEPTPIYPLPAPMSLAFIGLGKTERPEEDWTLSGGRVIESGAEGFFFDSKGSGAEAIVWLEIPDDSLTVAEQIGPTEVCVVCIPRGSAA